jgi:lipopolysaccharide/colanic/teichoic acid biosynthesis glycosyltransferase
VSSPLASCKSLSPSFPEPTGGRRKRILDLVITVPVLILLAPVFMIIAILIRRDSPGPAFYTQRRVGLDGKEFRLVKFRTMVVGAERIGPGLDNDVGDPRITTIGTRLRAASIDELPQLLNVLIGDMSIVGPRPTLRDQVERYSPEQRRRLRARPGITGLAQISGRSTLPWSQRIVIDLHYVDEWSLRLDLGIIMRTIPALLRKDETYPGGIQEVDLDD